MGFKMESHFHQYHGDFVSGQLIKCRRQSFYLKKGAAAKKNVRSKAFLQFSLYLQ